MRPIERTYSPSDEDTNGLLAAAGGATLTLLASGAGDGLAHLITLSSSGDLDGLTFTVTGTDADGITQSESLTGPSASLVSTTNYFAEVTAITASGTVSASLDAGWADEFVSPTVPLDTYSDDCGIRVVVGGTIDYTVQHTLSDIQHVDAPFDWMDSDDSQSSPDLSDLTASVNFAFDTVPVGLRLQANSYASGASLKLFVVHADGR